MFIDGGTGHINIGEGGASSDTPHHTLVVNTDNDGLFINNHGGTDGEYSRIMFGSHDVAAPRAKQMIGVKRSGDYGVGDLEFWVDSNADDAEVAAGDIKLSLTKDGRGVSQFTAKAWGQFDFSNMSTNDSHNFSSITDISTGIGRCNFTVAMANSSYAAVTSQQGGYISGVQSINTGNFRLTTGDSNWSVADIDKNMVVVFGD